MKCRLLLDTIIKSVPQELPQEGSDSSPKFSVLIQVSVRKCRNVKGKVLLINEMLLITNWNRTLNWRSDGTRCLRSVLVPRI